MEIVSSCNHRYIPDIEWERKNSLGAYRFECAPRQGKRNIGTRDQTCKSVFFPPISPISLSLLPLAQQRRIRETVLLAEVTVRFPDALYRDKNLDLQPRLIVERMDHFFDQLILRSSIADLPYYRNGQNENFSIYQDSSIEKKAQFYF